MTVINTNISSLNAQYSMTKLEKDLESSMLRLSTGLKVNSAADDAAGLAIVNRMESQIRGLQMAIKNANDGISMVATAEGSMEEISNMLQRMRELALQASNSVNNVQDREALNAEVSQLIVEIDRIANQTTFNDQAILNGSYAGQIQVGKDANQTVGFNVADVSAGSLGRTGLINSSLANVSASAEGTQATATVARLSFSGPDTYSFKVSGITVSGTLATATMTTDLRALATTINNNLTSANVTDVVAEAKNGLIELRNTAGDSIALTNFASVGNGTAQFDVVSGGGDSVHLNDTSVTQTSTTALGTEASSTGITLKLEASKAYSLNVNGASVSIATTDNDAAVKAKLVAALGSGYEVYASGDNASAALAAAGSGFTAGAAAHANAGEYIIFNNTAGKSINVTQFQGLGARAEGTAGVIRVAGGNTEAVLVDGTNQFTVARASATAIGEIDLSFTSTSSDYQLIIDGTAYLITGDDLAAGTAGAKLITDFNAAALAKTNDEAAAGLGSLGNTNGDGAPGGTGDGDLDAVNYTYEIVQNGSSINIKRGGTSGTAGDIVVKLVKDAAEVTALGANSDKVTGKLLSADNGGGAATAGTGVNTFDAVAAPTGRFYVNDDTTGAKVAASEVNLNETGAAVFQTQTATATKATLATSGNGSYNFKITDNTLTTALISTAVAGGSAAQMVADINAATTAAGMNTVASLDPNDSTSVILTNSDGKAIKLTTFSSPSAETILFSPSAGQGQASLLDDNSYLTSASASAAGLADTTSATMTFSGDDFVSFKIGDGVATATVRRVSTDSANAGVALKNEINSALIAAGIRDITVTATAAGGKTAISFTNTVGGKIDISQFQSDGSANATFSPASGQGAARILDDNGTTNASGLSVADIDISAVSSASSALEIIDNAIQQINDQRASLGAISNRLDHTISNLGNVVVNTKAAQSRILDADFSAETSNLTKVQILQQAATAMLAQANQSKQTVLALLQG